LYQRKPVGLFNMTRVLSVTDPNAIEIVAQAILQNELAVIPTDTVYGIAANLTNEAIIKLYEAKRRPPEKAIPLLLSSPEVIEKLAFPPSLYEQKLIETFMPGPLTIILNKKPHLPRYVSQTDTIGIRIPDEEITRDIIEAVGGALAVSSANISGLPAAHTLEIALEHLGDYVAVGIDGGRSKGQAASTIVQLNGKEVSILRAGPISKMQIERVLQAV
jgi:L-threonylcarbamoyladenylate synthase